MWCGRGLVFARPAAASAAATAATYAGGLTSSRCEQAVPTISVPASANGLGGYGLGDIPSTAYKAHFSEAYDVAAAKSAANVARRLTQGDAEPTADRRVRLGIARHLMTKLGYTDEELDLIGEDVLRMQGVKSPFDNAELRRDERVLDLGSGFGSDAFLAAAKVGPNGSVTGIDLSAEEVAKASARAQERGLQPVHCRFLQADMESLPIEAESMDVVISNGGFCLCPNKRASFQEVHRVLRPGGRMAISCTVLRKDLPPLEERRWPPCMEVFMPWRDIKSTLHEIGFRNVNVDGSNSLMDVWDLGDEDVQTVAGHLSTSAANPVSSEPGFGCSHARKAEERRAKEAVGTYLARDREAGIHRDNNPVFAHIKEFDMNELCARVTIYAEKCT
eukprot:gnl/TRDRNA2_/TRDRNA2_145562_c1_seq2.p1 gnl/TRDRNA2_/TRDRNA2_145562_c1~~gnl/TRDRNA2_/TRDRNA2_145562_c1_seq2.p1  ORF type:complete len:390 (-),score=61.84 gnl/TRDRNA2_/TRDRNA2_145562_c1_seq2:174-1343(-)